MFSLERVATSIEPKKIEFDKVKNTRIDYFEEITHTPCSLSEILPITEEVESLVYKTRESISDIVHRRDSKMIFVVGPCSIHNVEEAKEYARKLKTIADTVKDKILIVMRVYFEKPRTTVGWKGLINDPHLDGSFDINKGMFSARELLLYINSIGLPCGYEILDTITPQYISDLISWGAIGARTTESQIHRQLVSGLSMPVGFKNGTGGSVQLASDAIISSKCSHCFMGITHEGNPAICKTKGNDDCHIILRGSTSGTNYDQESVKNTEKLLMNNNANTSIMIDCSHGNSQKKHTNQPIVLENVIKQRIQGNTNIIGIMLESNLLEGSQKLVSKEDLKEGISITDACIDIKTTENIINSMYTLLS